MMQYHTLAMVDRHTAKQMAGEAKNHNGAWFQKEYGAPWVIRYAHSCIAAFVDARMKELGKKTIDEYHNIITVEYLREMFQLNEIAVVWPGDETVQMSIDTFLVAFIYDGDQSKETEMENKEGYEIIENEYCKYHSIYKKWKIYRAWNIPENHGKMKYFATQYSKILRADNLSSIKAKISKEVRT